MTLQNGAYLTVKEVAKYLNVSTATVYRLKKAGDFPLARKLSPGVVRWRLSDIEEWEATRAACFMTHLPLPTNFGMPRTV